MTAPAIELRGLTKTYGEKKALDGVYLQVPEGSVFGFLGPNGAGKTTTLRILTGLSQPTAGRALVFGSDVVEATNDVRAGIGFLPDVPGFYDWMTAEEFVRFAGSLFGMDRATLDERVRVLLDLAGLTGVKTRIGGFSRGMRQRLGIAQALVNAPKLLMLDEPTSALDPIGRKEVLDMISGLAGRTTVFFSTHILADVERVCDVVAILDEGRLVKEAPIEELKRRAGTMSLTVEVEDHAERLEAALHARMWLKDMRREGQVLTLNVTDVHAARRAIPAAVASEKLALREMSSGELSLEQVFVDLVGHGREGAAP